MTVDRATMEWQGAVGVVTQDGRSARPSTRSSAMAFICGPEVMIRYAAQALAAARQSPDSSIFVSMERNMKCAVGVCGHCQFGPCFVCKDGPVFRYDQIQPLLRHAGGVRWRRSRKLAVFKFASCDGCQLSLLDCEDELLAVVGRGRGRELPRGLARGA